MAKNPPAGAGVSDIVTENATRRAVLDLQQVTLLGIAGRPGDRVAILRSSSGRIENAHSGDLTAAGVVMEIEDNRVVLWRAGSELVLRLPRF